MLFWKFYNKTTNIKVVGKLSVQHFNVLLFSKRRDKVHILVESRVEICPGVFLLFGTLAPGLKNNDRLKWYCKTLPTTINDVVMFIKLSAILVELAFRVSPGLLRWSYKCW